LNDKSLLCLVKSPRETRGRLGPFNSFHHACKPKD
jgi:hypothetical protein